jgi:nucleoside-diphosphate-sugar epimerase
LKVLFIGGTGIISSACSELAIKKGIDLYHLNRGESAKLRPVSGVKTIKADIRDFSATQLALENHNFDAVVEWIGFVPEHIQTDMELFRNKTKQYVFIGSSAAYQTPPEKLPITEETPLDNPVWEYARNKIACENRLHEAFAKDAFPYTVVRPSHTYDKTLIPLMGAYTTLARMKQGLPVIVHGDGASIWTLTHHIDFAKGLVGLLGKVEAIGQTYHITSDEYLSWENIFLKMARALGVSPNLVHIPSDIIASYDKELGDSLLGDKTHSMIFDNSKIKALVPEFKAEIPFDQGAQEIVDWYASNPDRQIIDERINDLMEKMIVRHR